MTTYAEAEADRQRAVTALRNAGLSEWAERLAALSPITDERTAYNVIGPAVDAGYTAGDIPTEPASEAATACFEAAGDAAYAE